MTPYEQATLTAAMWFGAIGVITGVAGAITAICSLVFSRRAIRLATERHDVVWVGHWANPCKYVLTNTGTDTAEKVNAAISVLGASEQAKAAKVEAGEQLEFEFVDMAVRSRANSARNVLNHLPPPMVTESVIWFTKLGSERNVVRHVQPSVPRP